ncbi:MAG TPA: DALR domain-containing protein, partial [Sediminibacterium sp.]|nr:DALR domain-containing protein [Sediminibacterium sp.]
SKYLGEVFDIHGGGMDLQFPHHECEIAQSTVVHHKMPARYWVHNNMITINGRKMGKSYNNVIKLSELFSGNHPLLSQPYHPMTIRFFILQSQYRGTLDFSNEALQAAEKALKRLLEAQEWLASQKQLTGGNQPKDAELDAKVQKLLGELPGFMDDDLNTAKVLANLFELVPVINSLKDGHIDPEALKTDTLQMLTTQVTLFVKDIFGLQTGHPGENARFDGVMQLLMDIRKDARSKKDFMTSDRIRDRLAALGIQLKDEKGGGMRYSV